MLGDGHAQLRQVEHLADLDPGEERARKLTAAATAPVSNVDNELVGLGDLGQVRSRGARLLAWLAVPAAVTLASHRLAQPVL